MKFPKCYLKCGVWSTALFMLQCSSVLLQTRLSLSVGPGARPSSEASHWAEAALWRCAPALPRSCRHPPWSGAGHAGPPGLCQLWHPTRGMSRVHTPTWAYCFRIRTQLVKTLFWKGSCLLSHSDWSESWSLLMSKLHLSTQYYWEFLLEVDVFIIKCMLSLSLVYSQMCSL